MTAVPIGVSSTVPQTLAMSNSKSTKWTRGFESSKHNISVIFRFLRIKIIQICNKMLGNNFLKFCDFQLPNFSLDAQFFFTVHLFSDSKS